MNAIDVTKKNGFQ